MRPPSLRESRETESAPTPTPNPSNNKEMFQIFHNVQFNIVQHKKYVKELIKLYKKMADTSFKESFKNALHFLFTHGDTSSNVDRVIQFVATFCTSLDDEEEFLLFIFEIIFNCQCVSGQSVRYRASQLLEAVLSALGDDAALDDDLCEKLLASQLQRLQDTRGAVRCRAALALQRLQNPMEPGDEVTRAYRFHMSCDPSSSVRRAVVMSIAKCSRNVPYMLERLCDVDEAVRRAAFLHISAINVTQLKVRQRLRTLKVGLNERSPRVRRVVEEILIPGWLSTFKGNILDLLKAIRLDNASDAKDSQLVAGKLLESLFKRLQVSELLEWLPTDKTLRLIPAEQLNKETAWYWRHLAEHLQRIDDDETLEVILPDLVMLTGYIKAIVESPCPSETEDPIGFSTRQYVLHELACLLHAYDAGDQAGRTALQELITDVLTGDYGPLNPDVIRAFVKSLEMVIPEVSQRMEVVAGVISALREPPEVEAPPPAPVVAVESTELKLQRARLRVSLNVAMEEQEEAVKAQNYALAEECKAKVRDIQKKLEEMALPSMPPPPPPPPSQPTIREKLSDEATLNKCLNVLNSALDTPQLTKLTPMTLMIFNELEVEIFQNPEILESALETVALYGMLDKEFAKENKAFFFANVIDMSNERIVTTVLRCVVDILCAHGPSVFEEDDVTINNSHTPPTAPTAGHRKRVTYDTIDDDGNLSQASLTTSPQHGTVIEILLKMLEGTCSAYRLIIAEGLCRLLYLGHLESPTILSRLLLLWFNPATVEEDMLRQMIGIFFQTFASTVEGAQEQLQKATIPTLRALANAPSSSPISEIDQEALVRFIVSLTRTNQELTDSQGSIALTLCSHLVQRPASSEAALICRMLALLSPPRDATIASDLATMLRDLSVRMPDKQSSRNLTRYLGALEISERASLNKISQTGVTEATNGTMQSEDTLPRFSRITTSLPQPIARSTRLVINETVEEEPEIDESSPTDLISRISEELQPQHNSTGKESTIPEPVARSSENNQPSDDGDKCQDAVNDVRGTETDSSGVSPVKKAKTSKGKKKKLSMTKDSNSEASTKPAKGKGKGKTTKGKKDKDAEREMELEKQRISDNAGGGVKRSRSQRSLDDIERGKTNGATKGQPAEPVTASLPPEGCADVQRSSPSSTVEASSSSDSGSTGDGKKGAGDGKKGAKAVTSSSAPKFDLDASNVTIRRSNRVVLKSSPSSDSCDSCNSTPNQTRGSGDYGKRRLEAVTSPFARKFDFDTSNVTVRRSTRSGMSPVTSSGTIKGGKALASPKFDFDTSNVTIRRSPRGRVQSSPSGLADGKKGVKTKGKKATSKASSSKPVEAKRPISPKRSERNSESSEASLFEDSADETELHTIVYDQELVQSLLDDSSEIADSTSAVSKTGNVTVPETPDNSDESDSDMEEIINARGKGKRNGKNK